VQRSLGAAKRASACSRVLTASAMMLVMGAITAVLWVGAQQVIAGTLSAGTLAQFVLYAMIGAGSVGALTEVWSEVQRASGGMARINELFAEDSHLAVPALPTPLAMPLRGELRLEHVTSTTLPARHRRAADFSLQCVRARRWRWSALPAPARARCSSCCCASTTRNPAACCSTASTCASSTRSRCASTSRWCRRTR
jgi:ABC-type multidrug transport system fused ATPase/permease subunit